MAGWRCGALWPERPHPSCWDPSHCLCGWDAHTWRCSFSRSVLRLVAGNDGLAAVRERGGLPAKPAAPGGDDLEWIAAVTAPQSDDLTKTFKVGRVASACLIVIALALELVSLECVCSAWLVLPLPSFFHERGCPVQQDPCSWLGVHEANTRTQTRRNTESVLHAQNTLDIEAEP